MEQSTEPSATPPGPETVPSEPEKTEAASGPALAVFAHPDDAEICAGGTLAKWAREGRAVHLLVLTNGDRGSEDADQDRAELAVTRVGETEAAAKALGLARTRILPNHDGDLENSLAVRAAIVRTIREVRPSVVLTCDPTAWFFGNRYFNHADHRMAGEAALDAVFPAAGNPLFFQELLSEGLAPHKVREVWLGWTNEPNSYHDVTGFMDLKLSALFEHRSQLQDSMVALFEEWLPREAEENGRKIGVRHAEAFRVLTLE
jgi:LmbE family N-acetylglucosaminyl deacetylase